MNFPIASIACFVCTAAIAAFLGHAFQTGSITVNGKVYDRGGNPKAFWGAVKSGIVLAVSTLAIGVLILVRQS